MKILFKILYSPLIAVVVGLLICLLAGCCMLPLDEVGAFHLPSAGAGGLLMIGITLIGRGSLQSVSKTSG